VTISGLTWSDYNGHDNGGLPYPFDYSNVDDWAGSSSGDPVTITFTGLNDSKTYDFTLHAGWLGGINQAMRVSSSDGKVSSVIDTTPTGAPNIATITAASPTGTVLQFTVQTTNGTDTPLRSVPLMMQPALTAVPSSSTTRTPMSRSPIRTTLTSIP
jgi:hypothetical protein